MVTRSNYEYVVKTGYETVSLGVLNGGNVEGSIVLLNVHELSDTALVMTLGDHYHSSDLELDDVSHLSGSNVNLDGIIGLNIGVGVTDGASIVCDGNRYLVGGHVGLLDLAELDLSLFLGDTLKNETSLGIKKKTEDVSRLLELDDVHESCGEIAIGTDLSINLYTTLKTDLHALLVGKGVLETVTKDDGEGKALTHLVGSSGRLGGKDTTHLSEVPVTGCVYTLEVLLESVRPGSNDIQRKEECE
mmetsp:Transcript_5833/g.6725  ORF Transcript_5833/g.6725 Transcript_5833/m.6725 type:complete len:246 (-) Transcript_5833:106-843(-)